MGSMSLMHWLVVLAIVLVLFGAGKLPRVMGDFAKGIKAFKSGMKEEDETAAATAASAGAAAGRHRLGRATAGRLSRAAIASPIAGATSASEPDARARRGRDRGAPAPHRRARRTRCGRFANDRLEIRHDPVKGRGVFARAPIGAGTLIEAAPVIIVPADQRGLLDNTILHDYYFRLGRRGRRRPRRGRARAACRCAIIRAGRAPASGAISPRETLDLLALTPIAAGDEITIDYNCPLWFEPRD